MEEPRAVSLYPQPGMEEVYLRVMGIENNQAEIERQRAIARECNIDWLIFLRECSEEIQLLTYAGVVKLNTFIQ
jgi:hypothetical protein